MLRIKLLLISLISFSFSFIGCFSVRAMEYCGCPAGTTCSSVNGGTEGNVCCDTPGDAYGGCKNPRQCNGTITSWTTCTTPGPEPTPGPGPGAPTVTPTAGCTGTASTGPVLVSPADGSVSQSVTTALSWSPPSSWGAQCGLTTRAYILCVGTDRAQVEAVGVSVPYSYGPCNTSLQNGLTATTASIAPAPGTYYWSEGAANGWVTWRVVIPNLMIVTGHIYDSEDMSCSGTTNPVGYVGGTMILSNTDGLSGWAPRTVHSITTSHDFANVAGNVVAGYQYTLSFANDDPIWIMQCPLPASDNLTVKDQPVEKAFYITQKAEPWWQTVGGDAGAAVGRSGFAGVG